MTTRLKMRFDGLVRHKARLEQCKTFEEFKLVQLQFIEELIDEFKSDTAEWTAFARQVLEENVSEQG